VAAGPRRAAGKHQAHGARQLPGGSRWRGLLKARWQDRLHKVTELILAFHDAGQTAQPHRSAGFSRHLMRRVANTDDALLRDPHYGHQAACLSSAS
jgi:hypothetical protein